MGGQFPMFRLVTLLLRQLSAPVASSFKEYASRHPWFSRSVCMSTGRAYHEAQLRCKLWVLALRQPRTVAPIPDRLALDTGADLLGEVAVFGLGGCIIALEVNRQANKQEDKELDKASQWVAVLMSLEELQRELVLQQNDIDRLQAALRPYAPRGFPHSPGPSPTPSTSPRMPSLPSEPTAPSDAPAAAKGQRTPPHDPDDDEC